MIFGQIQCIRNWRRRDLFKNDFKNKARILKTDFNKIKL